MLSFSNIFIIAKHEVLRFRSRFQGKTRLAIIMMVIAALAVFFFISIGGLVLSKEFYAIGIAPDGPSISDQRFHVLELDYNRGMALLQDGTIDAYVASNRAFYRKDSKSQYATGAIKQYLEGKELVRISNEYDIERSFPLRVEINYLKSSADGTNAATGLSLAEIIDLSQEPSATGTDSSSDVISTRPQNATDEAVKRQLEDAGASNKLRQFKAEFASDKEVIIPSLMNPPIPLAQVLLAFFYVVPIFLVIIFFTSSFIEEKLNKRLSILLSTPTRAAEIILGKMLPYFVYSLIIICAITLYLKGNVGLALAVFVPIVLFIFAVYLGVALLYRTFRDQTFFSMLAITVITGFLVFPAMFTGINNLSYISPLSLAVHMYRGEQFTGMEYLLSTGPMYLVFALAMIGGIRIFNEEYLTNYKPLHNKISDALFLALNKKHIFLSIFIASLLLIPLVFMVQLGGIVLASNLPMPFALLALLTIGIVFEEIAKSCSIAVLIQHKLVTSWKNAVLVALISAAAFFLGEKLLLFFSMSIISESIFTTALFTTNLIWLPLLVHAVATLIVTLITYRVGVKHYSTALIIGSAIHLFYNLLVMGILQ